MSAQSSKDDSKITPRTLENQPPEARKSTSGGSKMRPKWLQNGSPKAPRSRSRLLRPLWSAPGRPGAAPGAFLGRSWRLLGSSWASQGVPGGSQRVPGRLPESLRDVILGAFLRQGLPARKSKKNTHFSRYVRCCFYYVFCSSSSPSPLRRRKRAP